MGGDLATLGPAEAKSVLSWWLEAGVDAPVQEEARDWLAPPAPRAEPVPEAPNVKIPDPQSLEALKDWLATGADLPLAGRASRRALPHGPEAAEVMLLSEAPGGAAEERPIGGRPFSPERKSTALPRSTCRSLTRRGTLMAHVASRK